LFGRRGPCGPGLDLEVGRDQDRVDNLFKETCQKRFNRSAESIKNSGNSHKMIRGTQATHMNDAVGSQDIDSCDGGEAVRASGQFGAGSDKLIGVGAVGGNGFNGLAVLECR